MSTHAVVRYLLLLAIIASSFSDVIVHAGASGSNHSSSRHVDDADDVRRSRDSIHNLLALDKGSLSAV